jgi:hypothetical protein
MDKERVQEGNEYDFDNEADDLEREFTKSLCEDYRMILSKEYEYLTNDTSVTETLIANTYEFTKDGEKFTTK